VGLAVIAAASATAVVVFHVKVNTGTAKHRAAATTSPSTRPATTTTVYPGRPPQQVRVDVLNGSGMAGAAGQKALALGTLGYRIAGVGNAIGRAGTAVQCKPGFEAEAATLAKNLGGSTAVEPFPSPAPAGSTNADCVVVLGR
jgi:hypothetical protein